MDESAAFKWKIVVIGDPSVGKTSLMLRFTQKKFRELYVPTVGVQVSRKIVEIDKIICSLNIWDIAGQQKFSNVRRLFYEGADAVVIVFDITEKQSFVNASTWYKDFLSLNDKELGVLLGNKVDLEEKRVILDDWGRILSGKMGFQYFETSAKTGKNIESVFSYLAKILLQKNE